MSSITLAFSSDRGRSKRTWPADCLDNRGVSDTAVRPLAELRVGACGTVEDVGRSGDGRTDRLLSLGVTPGARVRVLQTFPGVVFLCDQTELAVERSVAHSIFVQVEQSSASGPELPTVEEDRS